MKFAISTAALLFALGTTVSTYAAQDKGKEDGHSQDAKSSEKQAKPAQEQRQAKPAEQQQTHSARAAQRQSTQHASAPTQESQPRAVNHTQQSNNGHSQARVQQTHAANGNGGGSHGRISDDHYRSNFGSEHRFHVNRGEYDSRRFEYGGYSFGFVDPWPVEWAYDDDVYVVYADNGYYMYDRVHPGARISINIF